MMPIGVRHFLNTKMTPCSKGLTTRPGMFPSTLTMSIVMTALDWVKDRQWDNQ